MQAFLVGLFQMLLESLGVAILRVLEKNGVKVTAATLRVDHGRVQVGFSADVDPPSGADDRPERGAV